MTTPSRLRVLAFVPSARNPSETFIRANLRGLPFDTKAYFGDAFSLRHPGQGLYALAVAFSKLLYKLRMRRLGTLPPSLVAYALCLYHRPDALIAEFGFHAVRMMEAAVWADRPLVVQFHGADASARDRIEGLKERYRRLLSIAAGVVAKSQPMHHTLLAMGAPAERMLVSPCGADAALFHGGAAPATAPPLFLAVGRFVAKKGPLITLQAFAAMRALLPAELAEAVRLEMVGDGPLLAAARQEVHSLGLQQQVQLLGLRAPAEVAARMRASRAFVQHSLVAPDGDCEGSPVSVMEAQLSGLPVVSTFHAGIPEVVSDGVTGLLVEEGDVAAMAAAMAALAADAGLAGRLGAAARERSLARFTVGHHLADVAALMERVVAEHLSRPRSAGETARSL